MGLDSDPYLDSIRHIKEEDFNKWAWLLLEHELAVIKAIHEARLRILNDSN